VIAKEHGVDAQGRFRGAHNRQLHSIGVFFDEADDFRFVPRCGLVRIEKNLFVIWED
jgi:hypothetical protein